jgi:hypothetical protein
MAQANGASISLVHDTLLDLANKDQQGFVSDAEFNNFAQIAQLNVYNRLFDELKDAKRLSRAGFNPMRDKSRIKRIEEDLAYFSKKSTITKSSGVFDKPTDLSRIISVSTAGSILLDQSTKKPIELCYDEEKIERILISTLSSPTEDFPVALVSDSIHVFPTSINKVELRYYKLPGGRDISSGARVTSGTLVPTYSSSDNSVDFELPEHYTADLVYEIAKMVGINLRDADVVSYANGEVVSNRQAETF